MNRPRAPTPVENSEEYQDYMDMRSRSPSQHKTTIYENLQKRSIRKRSMKHHMVAPPVPSRSPSPRNMQPKKSAGYEIMSPIPKQVPGSPVSMRNLSPFPDIYDGRHSAEPRQPSNSNRNTPSPTLINSPVSSPRGIRKTVREIFSPRMRNKSPKPVKLGFKERLNVFRERIKMFRNK